jgi:SAM-dependent methyltransferase
MDDNLYWAIAERDIEIQNPVTDRKLRLLDDYCDIRDGLRVLDVGCGKAWLMRQWAERFAIEGYGIETNPRFLEVARRRRPAKGKLDFFRGMAERYQPEPDSWDVVMCLGASFAIGNMAQAIDWIVSAARPGGTIVYGDITLKHRPEVHRGEVLPLDASAVMDLIERHGAEVSATISASDADFERYESHHRHATLTWARGNPDHPHHAEVLEKSRADWLYYQRHVRPMLGWTIFVGRKFDAPTA